jgi:predicted O-methyltransferase YrrM
MLETTNLRPPAVLKDLEQASAAIGFTLSSDTLTGALLRTLVASKPIGDILELGTGTGMGTAWLLAGLGRGGRLISVDKSEETTGIARRFLGSDPRVTFVVMDGADFIQSCSLQQRTFDLIFADTYPGKFQLLDETLALLKEGGLYVVDDLNPQPTWPRGHAPHVEHVISTLEQRTDVHITKLNWSTGLLIAAKY